MPTRFTRRNRYLLAQRVVVARQMAARYGTPKLDAIKARAEAVAADQREAARMAPHHDLSPCIPSRDPYEAAGYTPESLEPFNPED
jgi:hypothetical protein